VGSQDPAGSQWDPNGIPHPGVGTQLEENKTKIGKRSQNLFQVGMIVLESQSVCPAYAIACRFLHLIARLFVRIN